MEGLGANCNAAAGAAGCPAKPSSQIRSSAPRDRSLRRGLTERDATHRLLPVKGRTFALCIAVGAMLLAASCSSRQDVVLRTDGSGTARIHVQLSSLIARYLSDLEAVMGGSTSGASGGPPLFDLAQIEAGLSALPGVTLLSASTPTRDSLDLSLSFDNVGHIIPGDAQPLSFAENGNRRTVRLDLSQQTLPSLLALSPIKNNPVLSSLGPQSGHPYTRSEYLGILDYAFSDYASNAQIKSALESSFLTIRVTVDGTILSQSGGTLDGSAALFKIPLIDLVTLTNPIDLSVTFR